MFISITSHSGAEITGDFSQHRSRTIAIKAKEQFINNDKFFQKTEGRAKSIESVALIFSLIYSINDSE